MAIATGTALLLGALGAAGGSAAASAISSRGANRAAQTQAQAAEAAAARQAETDRYAIDQERDAAREAIGYQRESRDQARSDLEPWRQAGASGINALLQAMGLSPDGSARSLASEQAGGTQGFRDWNEVFRGPQFTAPGRFDVNSVQVDPGFDWRLEQGTKALERTAAARGNVLGGGQSKAVMRYAQGLASDEYGRAYDRAYGRYSDDYARDYGRFSDDWNRAFQDYGFRYNVDRANQTDRYNRLAGIAGVGQQATNTAVNAGQVAATNIGNIGTNSADVIARIMQGGTAASNQAMQTAAAARAQGQASGADAWANAFGNMGNLGMLLALMGGPNNATPGGSAQYANTWRR